MLKALWDIINGHKLNTGTVVVIAAVVMQQYLGIDHETATNIATQIMLGVGGVLSLVGYIHRLVKAKQAK